jgi:DNA-binding Lrp family transcriptional regulator
MTAVETPDPITLDRLDKEIVRALQLSPRASFRVIAEILGVAEQTANRRYRSLHRAGVLRVVGAVDPVALGESDWMVRLRSRPDATLDLGRALAQRDDISWVSVTAGGAEIVCALRARSQRERERLLIDRLPRTATVLEVQAAVIMRRFVGGSASDWLGVTDILTADQQHALSAAERPRDRSVVAGDLDAADQAMLTLLARDGRAGVSALARAAGTSEGVAGRRLTALLDAGVLYIDVDLAGAALGFPVSAYVWLTVAPAHLDAACRALSAHGETPFVAAITGQQNVMASLTLRDLDALYTYVTERIGAIEGVQAVEVSPVLRRIKQAGTMMDGDRLAVAD